MAPSATKNLSAGGMCFISSTPLEAGRTYHLELELPDDGRLDCLGKVVWTRPEGPDGKGTVMGVEFVKISLEDQRRLYRFLDAQ